MQSLILKGLCHMMKLVRISIYYLLQDLLFNCFSQVEHYNITDIAKGKEPERTQSPKRVVEKTPLKAKRKSITEKHKTQKEYFQDLFGDLAKSMILIYTCCLTKHFKPKI
jgi:hypothetical protein